MPSPSLKIFSGVYEESYQEKRYKSKPVTNPSSKDWTGIRSLSLMLNPPDSAQHLQNVADNSSKIAKGVIVARELVGLFGPPFPILGITHIRRPCKCEDSHCPEQSCH
jgi:hypothetical protein